MTRAFLYISLILMGISVLGVAVFGASAIYWAGLLTYFRDPQVRQRMQAKIDRQTERR